MSDAGALYRVAQVRAFDAHAITVLGVPGYTLMKRAAAAALGVLRERWPQARRIAIATGGGNNGGDGLVLARLARASGLEVTVLALVPAEKLLHAGGKLEPFEPAALAGAEVLVDALLGTGLHEPVQPVYRDAIEALNRSGRPILALDLPSGLDGDGGAVMGAAVRATCTISFVALKTGLFLRDGPEHAGAVG
jgi:NAD(P)H-hydrate epimerase